MAPLMFAVAPAFMRSHAQQSPAQLPLFIFQIAD